ncbi:MAG: Thioredoxin reductase [Candidatus Moranbacteria bacterium GW2011_GWF2_34_56]|nr:MAG: Thioredoxin reductase [Candidatus Moranbacteria bacterium GW2011_GWF1_34_10]KKP65401.1 MAG: Thioredoxin reductase [Candidatus Moranbacteria bacterium GW2011_GWF2_34_56]
MIKFIYDLIIIGAGPAGLNASLYASRYGLKNVIVGGVPGGLTSQIHEIGNWLGSPEISGFDFAKKTTEHVKKFGAEIKGYLVDEINRDSEGIFEVLLSNGEKLKSKTILVATGSKHRKLGVEGEKEFLGKGVSYCATCDGFFYREKIVGIIGGSDSAVSAAVFMADIAKKVYLIYRGEKLRAENFWITAAEKNKKIEIIYNTNVKEVKGTVTLEEVVLDNIYNGVDNLKIDGLFVEIGFIPSSEIVKDLGVELDEEGYIKIEKDGKTTATGIWAAGDITTGSNKFKQIITAASEGAIAASSIQEYLRK